MHIKQINKFISSQKSTQFYDKVQEALKEVLLKLSKKEYLKITKNLILVVLHKGALGQVMHFPQSRGKFKILQITFPKKIPLEVLRFVFAHEFGHVMQGRNWRKEDGDALEKDADLYATKIGFPKTRKITKWMKRYEKKFQR